MDILVSIDGEEQALASLDGLTQFQAEQLLTVVADMVAGQNRRRVFEDNKGPNGEAWPPLSPAYANSPKKRGKKMLVLSGNMGRSIGYEVSGDTAWIGPSAHYSGYVHYGTRKSPARPFVGVSEANRAEIEPVIAAFVARAVGGQAA